MAHPDVQRITFTGSVEAGSLVQEVAGGSKSFKVLTLELGGKNPILVFPDVDPIEAAHAVVRGMNFTRVQGQSCGSTSRLLVHERLKNEILEHVTSEVSAIRDRNARGRGDADGFIDHTGASGASHAVHPRRNRRGRKARRWRQDPDAPQLAEGAFLEPTVFDDVHPSSRLASDEIFGPVLSTLTFSSEDEAIAIANSTRYGLSASVWTNDLDRALRTSQRLEAGYVWINDVETRYPGVPFGGWKRSGIGTEQGLSDEILSFTRNKSVSVRVRRADTANNPEATER